MNCIKNIQQSDKSPISNGSISSIPLKKQLLDEIKILIIETKNCYLKNLYVINQLKKLEDKEVLKKLPKPDPELKKFIDQEIRFLQTRTVSELQGLKTRALFYFDNAMNDKQILSGLKIKYDILEELNSSMLNHLTCKYDNENHPSVKKTNDLHVENVNEKSIHDHILNECYSKSMNTTFDIGDINFNLAYGVNFPTVSTTKHNSPQIQFDFDLSNFGKNEVYNNNYEANKDIGLNRTKSSIFTTVDKEFPYENLYRIYHHNKQDNKDLNAANGINKPQSTNEINQVCLSKENNIKYVTPLKKKNNIIQYSYTSTAPLTEKNSNFKKNRQSLDKNIFNFPKSPNDNQLKFMNETPDIKEKYKMNETPDIKEKYKTNDQINIDSHYDFIMELSRVKTNNNNLVKCQKSKDENDLNNKELDLGQLRIKKNNLQDMRTNSKNNKELWKLIFQLEDLVLNIYEEYTRNYQNFKNYGQKQDDLIRSLFIEQNYRDTQQELFTYKELKLRSDPNDLVNLLKNARKSCESEYFSTKKNLKNLSKNDSSDVLLGVDNISKLSTSLSYEKIIKEDQNLKYDDNETILSEQNNTMTLIKKLKATINSLKETNIILESEKKSLIETNRLLELKISMLRNENQKLQQSNYQFTEEFENEIKVIELEKRKIDIQKNMLILEKENLECTRKELDHLKKNLLSIRDEGSNNIKTERKESIIFMNRKLSNINSAKR